MRNGVRLSSGSGTWFGFTLVLVSLALLVGCAPGTQQGGAPTAAPGGATAPPGQVTPKRGGIFKTQDVGIPHINVAIGGATGQNNFTDVIYDRLLRDRSQDHEDVDRIPGLAERWEISPDGKTFTFFLRKDVKWQNVAPVNGRKFTSADVGYMIDFVQNTKASAMYQLWQPVAKHEEPDDYTVKITLAQPLAIFFTNMGNSYANIMPKELLETQGTKEMQVAVGTGPFQLKEFEPGTKLTAVRNPDYWEKGVDGKALPYLDGWETYTFKDYAARLAAYRARQVDRWYILPGPTWSDWEDLKKTNPELTMEEVYGGLSCIGFNLTKPHWQDQRMREAVSLALDRQKLIDLAFDRHGLWGGYVAPLVKEAAWSQEKLKGMFKYDPAKAQQLIRDAGYAGLKLEWLGYKDASLYLATGPGDVMVEQLRAVGLDMTQNIGPDVAFMFTRQRSGNFDIWNFGCGSASNLDDGFFNSTHSASPNNFMKLNDPAWDKMVEAQRYEPDRQKRIEMLGPMQDYLFEKKYWVPVSANLIPKPLTPWVKELGWIRQASNPGREKAWLDPSLKPR